MWFVEVEPAAEGAAAVSIGLEGGDELVVLLPHTCWELWRSPVGVGGAGVRPGPILRWAGRGIGAPRLQTLGASAVAGWDRPENPEDRGLCAVAASPIALPIDLLLDTAR